MLIASPPLFIRNQAVIFHFVDSFAADNKLLPHLDATIAAPATYLNIFNADVTVTFPFPIAMRAFMIWIRSRKIEDTHPLLRMKPEHTAKQTQSHGSLPSVEF
jgi:hypothetical protein